jgi:ABC-type Fe3+-hydroxamate transport system substrate-binding protein
MRTILVASAAAVLLAACSTATEPPVRSAQDQAKYLKLIDGRVAGAPLNCLPSFEANDMRVIDDQTIVFGERTSRVYVANLRSPCDNVGQPGFALVTRTPGTGMCSGDIATVVQTTSGITAGSCVIGTFTPYTRP